VHTFQNIFGKKIIIIFGPKSVQNLAFLIIIVQYIQEQAKWNNLMGIVLGKKKSSARPALITKKMGLVIQSMKKRPKLVVMITKIRNKSLELL